jgi:mannan endo-1,4-beta-mannosidase
MFEGRPYYFTGTNFWYGCYIGSPGVTGDRERLKRELDNLASNGITHLRILAGAEDSYMKKSIKPYIQSSPGVYNEELLIGLDYLLAELGKRNIKAVVFLNNYWEWTGGMTQYNYWADSAGKVDLTVTYDWRAFMNYSASFYANKKANEIFRNFVKTIITRKNTVSGFYYYEDPAIMAWQLANEPRPGEGPEAFANAANYYKWIDSTAGFIHSLDKNHLVTTGSEGLAGSMQSEEIYLKAHASKNIDFMTFHLWPKNWGWFRAEKPEETYPVTEEKALEYVKKHIEYASILGKPVIMEEFGIPRDYEKTAPGSPVTIRDRYYKKLFELIYDSASAGAPIAGTDFWAWGGEGRGKNADELWRVGDPFVGDPPQEPQGLNSVFDADKSTLEIIRNHAVKFSKLSQKEWLKPVFERK